MIELEPDRLDELAALVAQHMEAGRRDAGGGALVGPRRPLGRPHPPQDALRLWQKVTALVDELDEDEETAALAVFSRMLQLDYAWRLGMDRAATETLEAEATEIATRIGDLRSLALLKLLTAARPGVVADTTSEWVAAAEEAIGLADETGDPGLRLAIRGAGAYAYMCAGDLEQVERVADEMIELADGDPALGAGIVIGCPLAWALMAKSAALRERDRPEKPRRCSDEALRWPRSKATPRPRAGSVARKSPCWPTGRDRGGAGTGLRNCELTERLGDVFSRSMALTSMAYVRIEAGRQGGAGVRSNLPTASIARRWARAVRPRAGGRRCAPGRSARPRSPRGGAGAGRVGGAHRAGAAMDW